MTVQEKALWHAVKQLQRRLGIAAGGVPPSTHSPNHASGSTDPIDILTLDGYLSSSPALLFLREDAQWATPGGGGDVTGPGAATDKGIVRFDGGTGTVLDDTSGPILEDDGRISTLTDPTNADDAATKGYVDTATAGAFDPYTGYFRPGLYSGPSAVAGNFTTGHRFQMLSSQSITGAEFFIAGGAIGKNVKVQLWDDAGSSLKNVTVNSVVAGSNTATFASAQAVTAGTIYRISMYVTDGTFYLVDGTLPEFFATTYMIIASTRLFAAGDANPASVGGSERYTLNPTFA